MITIQSEGRRHYLVGDTYAIRQQIRDAGAHWDAERKAWWTAKKDVAEQFAVKAEATKSNSGSSRESKPLAQDTKIIGRADYRGHDYLLLWEGRTSRGTEAGKLAFRDGIKTFWADCGEYRVKKYYEQPISLAKLNRLADEYREMQAAAKAANERAAAKAAMTEEQRLAEIDAALAKIGRIRATSDDGSGPVTKTLAFSRSGKNSVALGETFRHTRKGKAEATFAVVSVGAPYNHTRDMCEDMDCFCGNYGWQTPYEAIRVADTPEEIAAVQAHADAVAAEQRKAQEIVDSYRALKDAIPSDYRIRHGALFGAIVRIDGETSEIRAVTDGALRNADWKRLATLESGKHLGGRTMDVHTLYRTALSDGRPAFREVADTGYGDDRRETYWLPEDVWLAICMAEIQRRGITREAAQKWLESYRGCVDTELYELAATLEPAPPMIAIAVQEGR